MTAGERLERRVLQWVAPGPLTREGVRLPPVRQRAFWAVQGLVFAIAIVHTLVEPNGTGVFPEALYLVPSSLFFVPVVYAALKFGVRGAVPTALWSIAVTVPNLILFHNGFDRLGVLWQGAILVAIGAFVGLAVDHERAARDTAEAREAARLASEARYRALFDQAADAVLVIDDEGRMEEANAAAIRMFRLEGAARGRSLADVVGPDLAQALHSSAVDSTPCLLASDEGAGAVWVEVVGSSPLASAGEGGGSGSQVIVRDVTLQHEREQGLEGYARHALAAREEERRRLARELHDGPLQDLMLLSRKLDGLAGDDQDEAALGDARDIIDDTAAELRRLSRALRPPILDDLGLVPALRAEATALARRSEIDVRFEVQGLAPPLDPATELLLLRVAQESLHNVERHSSAASVRVLLASEEDATLLVIEDDGCGIGPVPAAATLLADGKLGLLGIQERVRLAGGVLGIDDRPGGGTRVSVRLHFATVP